VRPRVLAEPRWLLSDALLEDLQRTEMHAGRDHGVRGACSVLIEGARARGWLRRGRVLQQSPEAIDPAFIPASLE
jgi:aerobic-type carbon monoxide dehydrogenase small subunit (CoxS/CutS family)